MLLWVYEFYWATVRINIIFTPIPVEELLPMPIGRKYSGNVYYDPIIVASLLGPNDKTFHLRISPHRSPQFDTAGCCKNFK